MMDRTSRAAADEAAIADREALSTSRSCSSVVGTGNGASTVVAGVRRRISGKRPSAAQRGPGTVAAAATAPRAAPLLALVINLDRRADRWAGAQARLAALEATACLRIERFSATDGTTSGAVPEDTVVREWTTDRNARYDGRQGYRPGVKLRMTPGERGCAMSHVRAWREVASYGEGAAPLVLILEDDAVLAKNFARRLATALAAVPADVDVLYLGYIKGAPWRCKVAPGLYEAEYLWTTVGYVLWPRGARKLLSALPVDEPVDNFMAWQMATKRLRALAVVPALVDQEQEWDCGSDVPHSDDVVLDS